MQSQSCYQAQREPVSCALTVLSECVDLGAFSRTWLRLLCYDVLLLSKMKQKHKS